MSPPRSRSWTGPSRWASTSSTRPTSTAARAGKGATEEIVGRWFAQGGGRRERTVLATKLYGDMGDWPNEGRLSALNIRRACDASLQRLQTDYIDLYQMHHIDRDTPWDEIWEAMEVLRNQGKILYVGSSNFAGWHIAKAQAAAAERHFLGLVSEQSIYNLLARTDRAGGPARRRWTTASASSRGRRSRAGCSVGVVRKEREGSRRYQGRSASNIEAHRPQLEQYEDLCAELGHEPATVALAWLLTRPAVTAPIIGPRTIDQFDECPRCGRDHPRRRRPARLDAIFPGHKTAPEDYAW